MNKSLMALVLLVSTTSVLAKLPSLSDDAKAKAEEKAKAAEVKLAEKAKKNEERAAAKAKKGSAVVERLAHRACNTMKGKIAPVVPWSPELFVVDPAPIFEAVERLSRKGGREVVARCPSQSDADQAAEWLLDRLSRFAPDTRFSTQINPGGGQFMLVLRAD